MPCFTQPVSGNQILISVFITAFAPDGGEQGVAIGDKNAFRALVDTGATGSCISPRVAQKIGIAPVGKDKVHTAGGEKLANVYNVNIHIPVPVGITEKKEQAINWRNFSKMRVAEATLFEHCDVLLGMDVIMSGGLHVSGGSFTFCT